MGAQTVPLTEARLQQLWREVQDARSDYERYGQRPATSLIGIAEELFGEIARLRAQVYGHCERIAAQSELLSKKAEQGNGVTPIAEPGEALPPSPESPGR